MALFTFTTNAVSTTDPQIVLPVNTGIRAYGIQRVLASNNANVGLQWHLNITNVRVRGATSAITFSSPGVLSAQAMDLRFAEDEWLSCPASSATTITLNVSAASTVTLGMWYQED